MTLRPDDFDRDFRDGDHGPAPGPEATGQRVQECAAAVTSVLASIFSRVGPETTGHLLAAGKELGLAMRSIIEGLAEAVTDLDSRRSAQQVQSIPVRGAPRSASPQATAPHAASPQAPAPSIPGPGDDDVVGAPGG